MTLREQVEESERRWRLFHEWEAAQPLAEREPERIIADVAALYDWLPASVRSEDPDPEKLGVRRMFEALSRLR